MLKMYIIILTVTMSFSFSAIRIEKSDNLGRLRFSSGELQHVKEDPETSVRSYLYIIRDKIGSENVHAFPLDFFKDSPSFIY